MGKFKFASIEYTIKAIIKTEIKTLCSVINFEFFINLKP